MGPLGTLLAIIFAISFMTFVTFFGRLPVLRHTPIASLYKLIWVYTPNALKALDQRISNGKITSSLFRLGNHLMYDRHPTVVIFFLTIMITAEALYLPAAWPQISLLTKLTAIIAVILPYLFLYLSCAADPGYVTPDSHAKHMALYPYDYALFHPNRICKTCNLVKPPRSKHCSVCKRCIARADHHCIFINSCVGYGNHHWFLLLLFSTAVLTAYGGLLGLSILSTNLTRYYPEWSLWPPREMSWTMYFMVWGLGIRGNVRIGASTLLAGLISPLVWGLFFYTLYLVYCGTTTNESLKWSEFKEDMYDGYAFSRKLRNPVENRRARWPAEPESILVATDDGLPPLVEQNVPGDGEWERVCKIRDVVNLYDLGFWDNLRDTFLKNPFGGEGEPASERERRMARNDDRYPP